VTVEARRDRKSRNADWYEEARGQGQTLRRCSRANCSAVNVEGNFAERSPDYRRCCGRAVHCLPGLSLCLYLLSSLAAT
jgi:hypothetical protein